MNDERLDEISGRAASIVPIGYLTTALCGSLKEGAEQASSISTLARKDVPDLVSALREERGRTARLAGLLERALGEWLCIHQCESMQEGDALTAFEAEAYSILKDLKAAQGNPGAE